MAAMGTLLTAAQVTEADEVADRLGEIVNPWSHAQELGVAVAYATIPEGTMGLIDGGRVWLDDGLNSAETRSTLAHECTHVELGHEDPQDDRVEAFVDLVTALRLVPTDRPDVRPHRSSANGRGGRGAPWLGVLPRRGPGGARRAPAVCAMGQPGLVLAVSQGHAEGRAADS